MNDLIWIGNTLYPRWIVFAAVAAIPVAFLVADIIYSTTQLIRKARHD